MKHLSMVALATAGLIVAGIADAEAFQRSGTVSSARGIGSYAGTVSCSGGTCSRSMTRIGAQGRTMTRSGSVTETAPGQYSYSATTIGPNGRTRSRSGSVIVTDGR